MTKASSLAFFASKSFLINSNEYSGYANHCISKSEMTFEEQEAEFEKQFKELLEE